MDKININGDGLLYRWYTAWLERGGNPKQLDLCHFVRVLVLWAPLRYLFRNRIDANPNAVPIGWQCLIAMATAVVGSALYVEALQDLNAFWSFIVSFVFGLILVGLAVVLSFSVFWGTRRTLLALQGYEPAMVAVSYIAAKKRRICPFITVKGGSR